MEIFTLEKIYHDQNSTQSILSFTLAIFIGTAGLSSVRALNILTPTGTVYQSSAGNASPASNLFDGTFSGLNLTNAGGIYSSVGYFGFENNDGGLGDISPVVAFNLGSTFTVSEAGFEQENNINYDQAGTISIYSLSLTQYTTYTATLEASGSTSGNKKAVAPTVYNSEQTLTTDATATVDGTTNYTLYTLPAALTGQYFVVQFNNADPNDAFVNGQGSSGGKEFDLIGSSAAPEPPAFFLLGVSLVGLFLFGRSRGVILIGN